MGNKFLLSVTNAYENDQEGEHFITLPYGVSRLIYGKSLIKLGACSRCFSKHWKCKNG